MEPNVKEEVDTLKLMVRNWKRGYEGWIQPDEDNEYVYREFTGDITKHLGPYIKRLIECEHLTPVEAGELVDYCHGQVRQLREETE